MDSSPIDTVVTGHLHVRSQCLRWELPRGEPPRLPSKAFLSAMKSHDRELECLWHPVRKRWEVYRTKKSVCRSNDLLIHQFTIEDPDGGYSNPGYWIIAWMKKVDNALQGALDAESAMNKKIMEIDQQHKRKTAEFDHNLSMLSTDLVNDLASMDKERAFSYPKQKYYGTKNY